MKISPFNTTLALALALSVNHTERGPAVIPLQRRLLLNRGVDGDEDAVALLCRIYLPKARAELLRVLPVAGSC